MFYLRNRRFDTSSKAQYLLTVGVGVASFPVMRMRLSPPELNYHNAGVYSFGQREESWAVRRKALGMNFSCANHGASSSVMQNVCGPAIRDAITHPASARSRAILFPA